MSLSKKELKDEFKGVLKPAGLNSLYDLLASIDAEQEIVLEPEPVVEVVPAPKPAAKPKRTYRRRKTTKAKE